LPVRDPCPPAAGDVADIVAPRAPVRATTLQAWFGSLTAEGDAAREVHRFPALSTIEAVRVSLTVAQLREQPVGQRDIDSWPAYWKLK
jgi:hypothetical protein